jgi:hypothetical protein
MIENNHQKSFLFSTNNIGMFGSINCNCKVDSPKFSQDLGIFLSNLAPLGAALDLVFKDFAYVKGVFRFVKK